MNRGIPIYTNSTNDDKRMTAWCNLVKIAVAVGKVGKGK